MPTTRRRVQHTLKRLGLDVRRYRPGFDPPRFGNPSPRRGRVTVLSFRWATTNELFEFLTRRLYDRWDLDADNYGVSVTEVEKHRWGLKGYGYCLIVDRLEKLHAAERRQLRVLDVGGGGSGLSRFLSDRFGDECWVVDDYGIESGDIATQGWYGPGARDRFAEKNPNVRYVFGRIGDERNLDVKPASFDLIFSISTLEHIPSESWGPLFDHMFKLLNPTGGRMVHVIDTSAGLL